MIALSDWCLIVAALAASSFAVHFRKRAFNAELLNTACRGTAATVTRLESAIGNWMTRAQNAEQRVAWYAQRDHEERQRDDRVWENVRRRLHREPSQVWLRIEGPSEQEIAKQLTRMTVGKP